MAPSLESVFVIIYTGLLFYLWGGGQNILLQHGPYLFKISCAQVHKLCRTTKQRFIISIYPPKTLVKPYTLPHVALLRLIIDNCSTTTTFNFHNIDHVAAWKIMNRINASNAP